MHSKSHTQPEGLSGKRSQSASGKAGTEPGSKKNAGKKGHQEGAQQWRQKSKESTSNKDNSAENRRKPKKQEYVPKQSGVSKGKEEVPLTEANLSQHNAGHASNNNNNSNSEGRKSPRGQSDAASIASSLAKTQDEVDAVLDSALDFYDELAARMESIEAKLEKPDPLVVDRFDCPQETLYYEKSVPIKPQITRAAKFATKLVAGMAGAHVLKVLLMRGAPSSVFELGRQLWKHCSVKFLVPQLALAAAASLLVHPIEHTETLTISPPLEPEKKDLRTDLSSLSDVKHNDSMPCHASFSTRFLGVKPSLRPFKFNAFHEDTSVYVSRELVAQMLDQQVCRLTSTADNTFTRIDSSIGSLQTVNFDRYKSLKQQFVKQHSAIAANFIFSCERDRLGGVPFPRPSNL